MRRKRRLTQDTGNVDVSGYTGRTVEASGTPAAREFQPIRTSQVVFRPLENAEDARHILITTESTAAERKADSEQNLPNLRCARSLCNQ